MLLNRRMPRAFAVVVTAATAATVASGFVATSAGAITADTTPPVLTGYSVVHPTVDTTHGAGGIGVVLQTTDDQSGLDVADVIAHCTGGCGPTTSLESSDISFMAGPTTAEQANVVISVPITIPNTSTWSVDTVTLTDADGNSQTYGGTGAALPNAAPTFTVTQTPDVSNPGLTSLTWQGAPTVSGHPTLDVTTQDKSPNFSLHLTDTGSGIDESSIVATLTGPDNGSGPQTRTYDSFSRIDGTVHNGDYSGFLDDSPFSIAQDGTWTVSVHVSDFAGNAVDLPGGDLVVSSQADSAGPTATLDPAPSVSPTSVNAGDTTQFTVEVADAVTGFSNGSGELDEEGGVGNTLPFYFDTTNLTTGGTYVVNIEVPYNIEPGTYDLTSLSLTDRTGVNTTTYDSTTTPALPSVQLTITSAPTEAAPSLSSMQLQPGTVSIVNDYNDRSAVAYLNVVDNGASGFDHGQITLQAPDLTTNSFYFDQTNRVSGNSSAGTYRVLLAPSAVVYPIQDGTYSVTEVDLWSRAQRFEFSPTTTIDAATLAGLSNATSFDVNHDSGDDAAPVIDSLELSPAHIDTTSGDQQVTVTVQAHDTGGSGATSGIAGIDVTLRAANSNQAASGDTFGGYYSDSSLISGDDTNGTFVFTIDVPQWATPGTWSLNSADIFDRAPPYGNQTNYAVIDINSDPDTTDISLIGGSSHSIVNDAANGDTTAPTVKNITVNGVQPLDASDGTSYRVTGTIEMVDDLSGVHAAEVDANGPNFQYASGYTDFVDTSGTAPQLDRTMTWTMDLPLNPATGAWTFDIWTYDLAGNSTEVPASLFPNGVTQSFQVTGVADSQAPTLAGGDGFSLTSASVDATSGPVDDVATLHVLDDVSGVASFDRFATYTGDIEMIVGRPDTTDDDRSIQAYVVAGNSRDAYFMAPIHFNQYGDGGTWVVKSVQLTDAAGNQSALIDESSNTITVTSLTDDVAPTINSITTSVDHLNLDQGAATVTVVADLSDDKSGVQSASFSLQGPSNADGGWADLQFNSSSGKWEGTATIPQYSGVGTWTPAHLYVGDNAGNNADYLNDTLVAKGATASYTFTGTTDSNAPTLASYSFNPTSLHLTGGPQNTVATLSISDDVSGFSQGYIQLSSPNGLQTTQDNFDAANRFTGDAHNGQYHVTLQMPSNAQEGTWTVSDIWLMDAANNWVNLTGGLLPTGSGTTVDVTNDFAPTFEGVVNGTVTGPNTGTPLAGAWVSVCNSNAYGCASATTDGSGHYSVTGLPDGYYDVDVSAPAGTTFNAGQTSLANSLYTYASKTATVDLNLTQPTPMPTGVSVNGQQSTASNPVVPTVYWQSPINLSINGCTGGSGSYAISGTQGNISSGSLTEGPAGTYTGTAPAPYPSHGDVTVTMSINCPNPADNAPAAAFTMYIDPSGNVVDTQGHAVQGATVTLFRSDTATGTFTQVADGSAIMSPSNRKNPDTSDSTGHYGWDVTAGYYKVSAQKTDCYAPGTYNSTSNTVNGVVTTAVQQIPPAVTDLNITLDCTNIAPVGSFTQSSSAIGQHGSVHFDASASKDANGSVSTYTWDFGDGQSSSSPSPTVDHSYNTAGNFTPKLTVTDDQNQVSAVKSGSAITVAPSTAPTVTITAQPPALSNATSASVSFTVTPNPTATIASVKCSVDGGAAADCTSPKTLTGLANGVHTVAITATDSDGNVGTGNVQWTVDLVAPTAAISSPSSLTTLAKSFAVKWSGSDANGVASYDVRYTKAPWNNKAGAPVTWKSGTTSASATYAGAPGYEYCFSVRAHDKVGNVGNWSAAKCTAIPLDDRSLAASSGWKKLSSRSFFLGTAMQTTAKGKTLTRKGAIKGRSVLIVDEGKGFGTINVLYNGKVVKKISLAATRTKYHVAITLPKVTKATTIVIKTTSTKKVQIDGLLLARV